MNAATSSIPKVKLTHDQRELLRAAIISGYSNLGDLYIRIEDKLGIDVRDWVPLGGGRISDANSVIRYFDDQGEGLTLLAIAWVFREGNPDLASLGNSLLNGIETPKRLFGSAPRLAPPTIDIIDKAALEKVVTERSPLLNFGEFQEKLEQVARAICLIDTGMSRGTGFLIGPSSVLTNYHVIESALDFDGAQIRCTFDFQDADAEAVKGTLVSVATGKAWIRDKSLYSESDLTGTGDPAPGQLDYALLQLAAPLGDRTPLPLNPTPPVVAPMDIAFILQHPSGEALSVAVGVVTELPQSGLRYRYNTTTKPGSSGAPVLSASLDLVGLHHAADPDRNPRYNQAVPTWRIAGALASAGIDLQTL